MNNKDHRELKTILNGCKNLQPKWQKCLYDLLFEEVLITISKFRLTKSETEDLMQDTFIRIFRQLDKYDYSQSKITTWASVIAKRLAINYCNSKYKRNLKYSLEELKNHQVISTIPDQKIDIELLKLTMKNIPEKYREVFDKSVFQGMKHKAIAESMNITESSSRVYLSRAIEIIKKDINRIAS